MSVHSLAWLGAVLMGACGVLAGQAYLDARERAQVRDCEPFAAEPAPGWVTLGDCSLWLERGVVKDEVGYERVADRLGGISRHLRGGPPVWTELVVPLAPSGRSPAAKVALAFSRGEALSWLNRLEQAGTEGARAQRLREGLERWRRVGRVAGEGTRDRGELQAALGTAVSPGVMVVRVGEPPPAAAPLAAVAMGLLGFFALGWAWVKRRAAPEVAEGPLDLSQVKLELGELDSLRRSAEGEAAPGPPERR